MQGPMNVKDSMRLATCKGHCRFN